MFDSLPLPNEPNRNLSDGSATYAYYIDSPNIGDILVQPQIKEHHTATVIMLHGAGENGDGMKTWMEYYFGACMTFGHIQFLFPTAPLQPFSPMIGGENFIWYDEKRLVEFVNEDKESVDKTAPKLAAFIKDELVAHGTPYNRIILGGFGQGGTMALHVAYRYCPQIAGAFILSSFLYHDSLVYESLEKRRNSTDNSSLPILFYAFGDRDEHSLFADAKKTYRNLRDLGVPGKFHRCKGMTHLMRKDELELLRDWIKNLLKE